MKGKVWPEDDRWHWRLAGDEDTETLACAALRQAAAVEWPQGEKV